jgi:hypothetical protein
LGAIGPKLITWVKAAFCFKLYVYKYKKKGKKRRKKEDNNLNPRKLT